MRCFAFICTVVFISYNYAAFLELEAVASNSKNVHLYGQTNQKDMENLDHLKNDFIKRNMKGVCFSNILKANNEEDTSFLRDAKDKKTVYFLSGQSVVSSPIVRNYCSDERVCVECNELTSLPSLDSLNRLEELYIISDYLTSIPSLDNLTELKTLYVECNQLTSFPSIDALVNLTTLYVIGENLMDFPALDTLVSLETLHIESNQLSSVLVIDNLKRLETLHVIGNNLTFAFAVLQYLRVLYIAGDKWRIIPSSIYYFSNLQTLNIYCNNLIHISQYITGLVRLEYLTIISNKLIQVSGISWILFKKLKILILIGKKLQSIPDVLFDLRSIEQIYINAHYNCKKPIVCDALEGQCTIINETNK